MVPEMDPELFNLSESGLIQHLRDHPDWKVCTALNKWDLSTLQKYLKDRPGLVEVLHDRFDCTTASPSHTYVPFAIIRAWTLNQVEQKTIKPDFRLPKWRRLDQEMDQTCYLHAVVFALRVFFPFDWEKIQKGRVPALTKELLLFLQNPAKKTPPAQMKLGQQRKNKALRFKRNDGGYWSICLLYFLAAFEQTFGVEVHFSKARHFPTLYRESSAKLQVTACRSYLPYDAFETYLRQERHRWSDQKAILLVGLTWEEEGRRERHAVVVIPCAWGFATIDSAGGYVRWNQLHPNPVEVQSFIYLSLPARWTPGECLWLMANAREPPPPEFDINQALAQYPVPLEACLETVVRHTVVREKTQLLSFAKKILRPMFRTAGFLSRPPRAPFESVHWEPPDAPFESVHCLDCQGQRVAVGYKGGEIMVFDERWAEIVHEEVEEVAFFGRFLLSVSARKMLVWKKMNFEQLHWEIKQELDSNNFVGLTTNGPWVLFNYNRGLYKLEYKEDVQFFPEPVKKNEKKLAVKSLTCLAINAEGGVAWGTQGGRVKGEGGQIFKHKKPVSCLVSTRGGWVSGADNGNIFVHTPSGEKWTHRCLPFKNSRPRSLDVSPKGLIAVGYEDGEVRLVVPPYEGALSILQYNLEVPVWWVRFQGEKPMAVATDAFTPLEELREHIQREYIFFEGSPGIPEYLYRSDHLWPRVDQGFRVEGDDDETESDDELESEEEGDATLSKMFAQLAV